MVRVPRLLPACHMALQDSKTDFSEPTDIATAAGAIATAAVIVFLGKLTLIRDRGLQGLSAV